MKYIKTFESRYKPENIDKKYYVWQIPKYQGGKKMAIIEIVSFVKDDIKYKIIKRNYGWQDFFFDKKVSDNYNNYTVSFSYWKRNKYQLLLGTDNLNEAIDFYETYEDAKKYNL